jgi:ABC-type transport system substrate-binding protein
VLRYAFKAAETGFDPAKIQDLYSRILTAHIFEGLYIYDHLARPAKVKPLTAAALPEVSADFRVFVIKLRPGIFFMSDPAFQGRRRELVAEDYVYAIKRFADPANKSPAWGDLEEANFIGLAALREEACRSASPSTTTGWCPACARWTATPCAWRWPPPAPPDRVADRQRPVRRRGPRGGGVLRPEEIMGHPVGTGPFKLVQWRRSSLIALERNPEYRERLYDAEPAADDAEGQALLARFKGRRLPMIDRVEVSIIEESQPRWLSFLNGQQNFIERVPEEFATLAMPNGRLAPNLAHQHMQGYRSLAPDIGYTLYNMEDPVVGGYTPEKIALRRAMNLGMDIPREIALVRQGQGIPAQSSSCPTPAATTRTSAPRWGSTTRPAPRPCWTSTATWTATATAGASSPTARRC